MEEVVNHGMFKVALGETAPNENQSGEATAYSDWWYYEGTADESADTPLNGTYLNRGPKAVMSALRRFSSSLSDYLNKPFVTEQIANKAITYDKLSDGVKAQLGGSSSGGSSGGSSGDSLELQIESIRSRNLSSSNKIYKLV